MGRSPKAIQSPALCGGLAPRQHRAGVGVVLWRRESRPPQAAQAVICRGLWGPMSQVGTKPGPRTGICRPTS